MTDSKEDSVFNHEDFINSRNRLKEFNYSSNQRGNDTDENHVQLDDSKSSSIPEVNSSNLKAIKIMIEVGDPEIFNQIRNNCFVNDLCELFIECEKRKDMKSLYRLCTIFKLILLSGDYPSLVVILSEGNIMNVIGALEYDKELSQVIKHRDFINNKAVFKYVINLPKESCFLIHRTYKLKYLRDVIVSRYIDDATLNTLTSMIDVGHQEIISNLLEHPEVMKEIIQKLRNQNSVQTLLDILGFLKELINLSNQSSNKVFQMLSGMGLYDLLLELINNDPLRVKILNLLTLIVQYDPIRIRNTFLEHPFYISNLILSFNNGKTINELNYITDIFQWLLHSPKTKKSFSINQHESLLELFYTKYADDLFSILFDQHYEDEVVVDKRFKLIELMTQFVLIHPQKMMNYIVKNNTLRRTNWLIKSTTKSLILDQIKLIRTCLSTKENAYLDYIIKENIFEPIVELYMQYKDNHNLINSTLLELFYFIKNNRIYKISNYIIENFYKTLNTIEDVDIFQILKLRYDEMKENTNHTTHISTRRSILEDVNEIISQGISINDINILNEDHISTNKRYRSKSECQINLKKQKKF